MAVMAGHQKPYKASHVAYGVIRMTDSRSTPGLPIQHFIQQYSWCIGYTALSPCLTELYSYTAYTPYTPYTPIQLYSSYTLYTLYTTPLGPSD